MIADVSVQRGGSALLSTQNDEFWMNLISSPSFASFTTTRPAIRSECPPIYLVALWKTISAPKSKGFCEAGEANVLSTTRRAPVLWAISAVA